MSDERATYPELMDATRQMAVLARLEFPLADGLKAMGANQNRWLGRLGTHVAEGDSLSQAVERHPAIFSPFYAGMVAAAEAAEKPERVLSSLSHWLERADQVQRKARTTLFYPLLLLNAALIQIALILIIATPSALLPLARVTGHPVSSDVDALLSSPVPVAVLLVLLVLLNVAATRPQMTVALLSHVPTLGPLQHLTQQGLWAEALGSLLAAGRPLPAAIEQAASVVTDARLAASLAPLPARISRGDSLSDALLGSPDLAPCLAWSVAAGERREDMAPLLLDAAEYIDREVDIRTTHALRMLEPWVQVAVGVVVCSVLLAFWVPYYNLTSAIR
jgi:type II secretory pathway component PulF